MKKLLLVGLALAGVAFGWKKFQQGQQEQALWQQATDRVDSADPA